MWNKEIDFKKFLLFLVIFIISIALCLGGLFSKLKPLCKNDDNPCRKAVCNNCQRKNGQKICYDCNIYNKDEEHIWTGSCIYE